MSGWSNQEPEPIEDGAQTEPSGESTVRRGKVAGRRGVPPRAAVAGAALGQGARRAGLATGALATATAAAASGGMAAFRRLSTVVKAVAIAAVVGLVAALVVFWPSPDRTDVTAHFTRAVGLYPGSEVRILGIPVGVVKTVEPQGETVEVTFEVDKEYDVPADAQAVVISPSVVSDRYVQLLPVYTSGPTLEDDAVIPVERTAVPVELDRIFGSLNDLSVALGPEGANSDGALSRVLDTGANNLGGQGENLGSTIEDLSLALDAVASTDDDLFTTVENLQVFTTTLAENDQAVTDLNNNLATVSDQLAGEREDLALALSNLAVALTEVSTFVQQNRDVLTEDIRQLEVVTASVASQQEALAETLVAGPTALSNLENAYNPRSGTLDTRNNFEQGNPLAYLCSLINGSLSSGDQQNPGGCEGVLTELSMLLDLLPADVLGGLAGSRVPAEGAGLSVPAAGTAPAPAPRTTTTSDPTLAGILPGGDS